MRFTFREWKYITRGLVTLRESLDDSAQSAEDKGDALLVSHYDQQDREIKELLDRIDKYKHD